MNPRLKKRAVFVSLSIMAMMLASCNGVGDGTGSLPTPPAAPFVSVAYGVKSVILSLGR